MTIQFLDLRVSRHSTTDAATTPIPTTPARLLFGDIGLQTAGVSPANAGDIRVELNGYVKVSGLTVGLETLTITVWRGDPGTGVPILTTTYGPIAVGLLQETWGFTAVDFLTAAPLSGQQRYTATIESNVASLSTIGAASFGGTAAAGTTTS
ncbi:hypothetical protein C0971_07285 [Bacillus methanolicus]|uniref:hypothetical protein n=1 Tax=Bacillus methanolicus TaxID=1471 RepID=UPI00200EA90F|nr:hypothetical protein [Bacillus methanolicus]UQD51865.1 hypothetical protein C0971_07285 [Bacillus methanolicus]